MPSFLRRPPETAVLVLAGGVWLATAFNAGPVTFLLAFIPGALMLTSGTALFVMPGDRDKFLCIPADDDYLSSS